MRCFCLALVLALFPGLALALEDGRLTLTVGVQQLYRTLDPAMALANAGYPLTYNMFDTLIGRDFMANGEPTDYAFVPGLATRWERIDDRTLELTLREGVLFHNGEPLTSEDVVFTFERILDPESDYANARFMLDTIEAVEAVDALTVRVTTTQPDPILLHLLAYYPTMIVPKDYFEEVGFEAFQSSPVGTGPYRLVEYRLNEALVLEAFDNYWGGEQPVRTLSFLEIPEVSARITALANGEVDIITTIVPDQLAAVERLDCCELRSVLVNSHVLNYNTANPVMADARFRRGLNMAIDRQLLVDALWDGMATVLNAHQYAEWGADLFDADRPGLPFDPDQARQLIAESGYDGTEIVLNTHPVYYTNGLSAAQAIVEMWRNVGVNARVRVDENWYGLEVDDPVLMVRNLSDWQIPADPAVTLVWSWSTTALWHDNDAFLALAEQGRSTLDPAQRRAIYRQMVDLYLEEAPGIDLYRVSEFYGVRRDIDWAPFTDYTMDFRQENLAFR